MQDTCQLAARKALRYLCHMYDWHLGSSPLRYFPPLDRSRPAWAARIRNLGGLGTSKNDPTLVAMSSYSLSQEELCDTLNKRVKYLVARIKFNDNLWLEATQAKLKAEARAASAESRATLVELDLKEQTERYNQLLRDVHLAERAKCKDCPETLTEPLVLEGVPILHVSNPRRKIGDDVPAIPPVSPRGTEDEDPGDAAVVPCSQAERPADS